MPRIRQTPCWKLFQSSLQEDEGRVHQDAGSVSHDEAAQGIPQGKFLLVYSFDYTVYYPIRRLFFFKTSETTFEYPKSSYVGRFVLTPT